MTTIATNGDTYVLLATAFIVFVLAFFWITKPKAPKKNAWKKHKSTPAWHRRLARTYRRFKRRKK
jgi:hypothetical protein